MASKCLQFPIRAMLVSGIVALLTSCSGHSPTAPAAPAPVNAAPEIMSLAVNPSSVAVGQSADVLANAQDADGDALTFAWRAELGSIFGSGNRVVYSAAGCCAGTDHVHLTVTDSHGASASSTATVNVTP